MTCDLCGRGDCTWVHGEWCQVRARVLAGTGEMLKPAELMQMAMARTDKEGTLSRAAGAVRYWERAYAEAYEERDALAAQVETLRSALQRHHDFKGIAEALATTPPAALEAHDKRVRTEALAKGAAACAQMASECPFPNGPGYDAYIDCQRALLDLMDE